MKREIIFKNGFNGKLMLDEGEVTIGRAPDVAAPYDLLFGALASCLYATFLEVLTKKRIEIETCSITVEGEKREEIPMTLKYVHLTVKVKGTEKIDSVVKSFELACKYCSIYETLSKVAKMSYEVKVTK